MPKYIELDTNLKVASFEEALGRAYGIVDCAAWSSGAYPIPPYSSAHNPPLPEEYTYFYAQRARMFAVAGKGGVIRLPEFGDGSLAECERLAAAAPTHVLSNGAAYTLDLSIAKDWDALSEEGKDLFADDAPPAEAPPAEAPPDEGK